MGVIAGVAAIVLLVVANGFFVAAEFAYVAVDRNALDAAAAGGDDRSATHAVEVLRRLSFMLSGAQLGITATSLLVGFIAEPVSRSALEPLLDGVGIDGGSRDLIAVIAGFLLVTIGQMIFAELVPKNLAIARPERIARTTAQPMRLFMRGFGPLIVFFDAASNRLLRSVGIEPVEELSDVVSLDELDTIIVESLKEGSLDEGQAGLLEHVLAFRELRAADAATHRRDVLTIEAGSSCLVLRDMVAAGHSRFPVLDEEDQIVGIVHGQTLLDVDRSLWPFTTVRELMVDPVVVSEATPLPAVLHALRVAEAELAVVFDEFGEFFGLVTVEDLAEELVGDIQDETDPDPIKAEHPTEQVWIVPGSWRLDDVLHETGVELPAGHYETIAGFILTRLERMAIAGDVVRVEGARLRVEAIDRLRITQVAVDTTRSRREP